MIGIVAYLCSLMAVVVVVQGSDQKARLFDTLFQSYDQVHGSKIIPGNITVHFGVALVRAELDVDKKQLSAHLWLRELWKDRRLTWDPAAFGEVNSLRLPAELIWRPDIVLFKEVSSELKALQAVLYNNGDVLWVPQLRVVVDCINTGEGNAMECPLIFGSWTYNGHMMDLTMYEGVNEVDLSDFTGPEVEVIKAPAVKDVKQYHCCVEPYPSITYRLVVKPNGDVTTSNADSTNQRSIYTLLIVALALVLLRYE